ncbi:hypothetical protein JCM17380_52660 [Desulfosporosinus burensis]
MDREELLKIVARDEDGKHQFKADITNANALAAEMVLHGDEVPINGLTSADLDLEYFQRFFSREYGESIEDQKIPLPQLLENMSLASEVELNLAAALLFSKAPYYKLPVFIVKAVSYPSKDIDVSHYIESADLKGKLFYLRSQLYYFPRLNLPINPSSFRLHFLHDKSIDRNLFKVAPY